MLLSITFKYGANVQFMNTTKIQLAGHLTALKADKGIMEAENGIKCIRLAQTNAWFSLEKRLGLG